MSRQSAVERAWIDAFRPACRDRGMRFVSGAGFVLDDIYITALSNPRVFHPDNNEDRLRITWTVDIKPLAVDEILWNAFLPDISMGPRMRINRRINGAFRVWPLRIADRSHDVPARGEPNWDPILDEFERIRTGFRAAHPNAAGYAEALERHHDTTVASTALTRTVTALIAAGRNNEAARVAEQAIAAGESGGMLSTVDVLKYLSAWAKGPQAYSAFQVSLIPTHDYAIISESQPSRPTGLCREHHPSSIARTLSAMNGIDPWAISLSVRPHAGAPDAYSTLRYLQAAGTAKAMVIEYCTPGGAESGAVSVRSVVGHPHTGPTVQDVPIVLPHSVEMISRHELFTADEAAEMFQRFYQTDTIDDSYVMRPVEGYTADGGHIDLTEASRR